jgi:hypothetical protein
MGRLPPKSSGAEVLPVQPAAEGASQTLSSALCQEGYVLPGWGGLHAARGYLYAPWNLAREVGVEPTLAVLETAVLP